MSKKQKKIKEEELLEKADKWKKKWEGGEQTEKMYQEGVEIFMLLGNSIIEILLGLNDPK
jgi:hypothetical protein